MENNIKYILAVRIDATERYACIECVPYGHHIYRSGVWDFVNLKTYSAILN